MRSIAHGLIKHNEFVIGTTIERQDGPDIHLGTCHSQQRQERWMIGGSHAGPSSLTRTLPHRCPHCGNTWLGPIEGSFMEQVSTFLIYVHSSLEYL